MINKDCPYCAGSRTLKLNWGIKQCTRCGLDPEDFQKSVDKFREALSIDEQQWADLLGYSLVTIKNYRSYQVSEKYQNKVNEYITNYYRSHDG